MTGLENIIKRIEDDSQKRCTELIAKAEQDAEGIREQARAEGKVKTEHILAQAQRQAQANIAKAGSSAQMANSKALLAQRVALINKVIADAVTAIKSLPDQDYFAALEALALHHARAGSGVMLLSHEDMSRMPTDFESGLNTHLAAQQASLRIEAAQKNISGGFILSYGDIEQNCTFDALVDTMRDELKDQINRDLFE